MSLNQEGEYWVIRREEQKRFLSEHVNSLDTQKPFFVTIRNKQEARTKRQNRYIFGWVYKNIVEQLGDAGIQIPLADGSHYPYDKDILHSIFKEKFLLLETRQAVNKKNEIREFKLTKSTSELSKNEFSDYIERIEQFCLDFWHISIPEPTRGYWHDYYKELMR